MGKLTARKQEHDERPDEPAPREESEQDDDHEKEPGDRSCRADVEELSAVVENRTESNERAERSDPDRRRRSRQEVRRRHIHLVVSRGQIVTQLVTEKNGEE